MTRQEKEDQAQLEWLRKWKERRKASEKFHRPEYQAGKLIEAQGQQLWHGDVAEYLARKYKIGNDDNGEETGREQCKKRERQEENLSQGIQKTWEENQEDRIRD